MIFIDNDFHVLITAYHIPPMIYVTYVTNLHKRHKKITLSYGVIFFVWFRVTRFYFSERFQNKVLSVGIRPYSFDAFLGIYRVASYRALQNPPL